MEPIHQKYTANENTSRRNPKKKTNANNQQKLCKNPMQRGLMAMEQQSTITKKISNERVVIYHKSTNDGGALTMMCGRDAEPQQ
jgi:hypothetical protein